MQAQFKKKGTQDGIDQARSAHGNHCEYSAFLVAWMLYVQSRPAAPGLALDALTLIMTASRLMAAWGLTHPTKGRNVPRYYAAVINYLVGPVMALTLLFIE